MFGLGVAAGVTAGLGAVGVGVLVWCWRFGKEMIGPEGGGEERTQRNISGERMNL